MLRLNTAERVKIAMKDSNGNFKTGLVATDFLNSRIQITKGDGTTSLITLVLNTNLFEIDSTNSPGIYDFLLSTANTNTLGQFAIAIVPASSAFVELIYLDSVETDPTTIDSDITNVYNRIGAPVGVSISADIASVQTSSTAIKAKTDNLPSDPASQATTDTFITSAASAIQGTGFTAGVDDLHSISTSLSGDTTNITAIKAKTDLIGTSSVASQADVTSAVTTINAHTTSQFGEIEGGSWNATIDNLHAIQVLLTASAEAIKGSGFVGLTDSLHAISTAVANAIISIKGAQNISISDIAGGVSFIPLADNLHAISQAITDIEVDPSTIWDSLRASHTTPGTFGETMRVITQVNKGHVKVDKYANTLNVYQEDGTTLLYQCALLRNGLPSNIYADERLAATSDS